MDGKKSSIEKILGEFLKSEVNATDERIMSIRRFMEALQEEVKACSAYSWNKNSPASRETIAKIMEDMADIYTEELSWLIAKRRKIYDQLILMKVAACNGESARSEGWRYIN